MTPNQTHRRGEPFEGAPSDAIPPGSPSMKRSDKAFEPLTFAMDAPRVDLTKAAALAAGIEDRALIHRYLRSR